MKAIPMFAPAKFVCPVCNGTELAPFGSRPFAQCTQCKALERHRLGWLYIQRFSALASGPRTLHIAPDGKSYHQLKERLGTRYLPVDISAGDTGRYQGIVSRCDVCTDLSHYPSNFFDLVIHHHVLEHIMCDPFAVLREMKRIMQFGGIMLFSVPIRAGSYRENTSMDLTDDDRKRLFGQSDHVRMFGRDDVRQQLIDTLGHLFHDAQKLLGQATLDRAAIPEQAYKTLSGDTVWIYRKLDGCLLPSA